jgi:hypothetical protein
MAGCPHSPAREHEAQRLKTRAPMKRPTAYSESLWAVERLEACFAPPDGATTLPANRCLPHRISMRLRQLHAG